MLRISKLGVTSKHYAQFKNSFRPVYVNANAYLFPTKRRIKDTFITTKYAPTLTYSNPVTKNIFRGTPLDPPMGGSGERRDGGIWEGMNWRKRVGEGKGEGRGYEANGKVKGFSPQIC